MEGLCADRRHAAAAAPPAKVTARSPAATARIAEPRDRAVDRLQLDATAVTGNRELPKVMSIVPWKAAEPPGGPDRPMGSLIDELLSPLDRDVFRRQVQYDTQLQPPKATAPAAAAPARPDEPRVELDPVEPFGA